MSRLHNVPHTEVGHLNILNGVFAGTVTKTFNCFAGKYQICVAFNTESVSKASTVQVAPFADAAQTEVGTAYDVGAAGATATGTVAIGTGTNAEVEWNQGSLGMESGVFAPFGFQITFSTYSATGSGTIDFFARTEG